MLNFRFVTAVDWIVKHALSHLILFGSKYNVGFWFTYDLLMSRVFLYENSIILITAYVYFRMLQKTVLFSFVVETDFLCQRKFFLL